MIAKQYAIGLPADYDMGVIRRRVADKGPAYDTLPGLHFKAFLIRERSRCRAIGNEYAPFYVWEGTDALWSFVAGSGFRGIIDSFGWTPIRIWLTLDVATRSGIRLEEVRAATREERAVEPGTDLASLRETEIANNAVALATNAAASVRVVALNTDSWRLLRFALSSCRQCFGAGALEAVGRGRRCCRRPGHAAIYQVKRVAVRELPSPVSGAAPSGAAIVLVAQPGAGGKRARGGRDLDQPMGEKRCIGAAAENLSDEPEKGIERLLERPRGEAKPDPPRSRLAPQLRRQPLAAVAIGPPQQVA